MTYLHNSKLYITGNYRNTVFVEILLLCKIYNHSALMFLWKYKRRHPGNSNTITHSPPDTPKEEMIKNDKTNDKQHKKVSEKSRECYNHKPQPCPDQRGRGNQQIQTSTNRTNDEKH